MAQLEQSRRSFSIERCLGRGGFGEVYRAEMRSSAGLSTAVALKILRRDVSPHTQALARLRDEGLLLAQLNHPAILKVHDLVVLEGRVSLVTEFVDGDDLERCMRGQDRIPVRALLEVVGQVASALDAAYNTTVIRSDGQVGSLKLVHRDIKPSNIRISRHGEVKLLDFGIARTDELAREARTQTDLFVGSPPYMAPERYRDNELRPASDVFGLGATLLEGLIGRKVFAEPMAVLAGLAHVRERFEAYLESRLEKLPAGTHPEVVALARQMLAYLPEERPTAAAVASRCEVLADLLEGSSLSRWCRARRWSETPREAGDFDGRIVTEGTLLPEKSPPAEPAPSLPSEDDSAQLPKTGALLRRTLFWLGSAGVASGGLATVAGGLLLAGAGLWVALRDGSAVELARGEPVVVTPVRPAPTETAPVEPAPVEPAPVVPIAPIRGDLPQPSVEGAPKERPAVAPVRPPPARPVLPDPAPSMVLPEPPPAPAPAERLCRVELEGDVARAELTSQGRWISLPASVPPDRYTLQITHTSGASQQLLVDTSGCARVIVKCDRRMNRCAVLP